MLSSVIPLFNYLLGKLEALDFSDDEVMNRIKESMAAKLWDYYNKTDKTMLYMFSQCELNEISSKIHCRHDDSGASWSKI